MLALHKTFDFQGRSRRSEFWGFVLIAVLFGVGANFWDNLLGLDEYFRNMLKMAFFLTSVAVSTRRLHDTGRSGWWQLIGLTGIGAIVLVFWYAQDSDYDENEFGRSPKYDMDDYEDFDEPIREKRYDENFLV